MVAAFFVFLLIFFLGGFHLALPKVMMLKTGRKTFMNYPLLPLRMLNIMVYYEMLYNFKVWRKLVSVTRNLCKWYLKVPRCAYTGVVHIMNFTGYSDLPHTPNPPRHKTVKLPRERAAAEHQTSFYTAVLKVQFFHYSGSDRWGAVSHTVTHLSENARPPPLSPYHWGNFSTFFKSLRGFDMYVILNGNQLPQLATYFCSQRGKILQQTCKIFIFTSIKSPTFLQ